MITFRMFLLTCLALDIARAPSAYSQTVGPECQNKTFTVAQSPSQLPITFDPVAIGPACSDAAGHKMRVTYVSAPAKVVTLFEGQSKPVISLNADIPEGGSVTLNFTVTDDQGQGTTSSVTVTHIKQPQS